MISGLKSRSLLWMGLPIILAGCSSQTVKMIHPQTGATAECSASGFSIGASMTDGFVGGCASSYQNRGYVKLDQLSAGERSSLEQRGLLPKN